MKIGLVIEGTYPWYIGGVSEWVYRYLHHLRQHDFYLLQIATDEYRHASLQEAAYPIPDNVKTFVRIPVPPLYGSENLISFLKTVQFPFGTFREVQIFHATNTGFAGIIAARLAEEMTKPLLLTEHAVYWKEIEMGATALECGFPIPSDSIKKAEMVKIFKSMASEIYRKAVKVISVSRYNMIFQRELGCNKVEYIPNGAVTPVSVIREERKVPFTLGWVGRCAALKDPLRFLDVCCLIRRKKTDIRFLACMAHSGEDELERRVLRKAKNIPDLRIIWNERAEKYYKEMDALLITSRQESQPLVVFEAIAHGVLPFGWKAGDLDNQYGIFLEQDTSPGIMAETVLDWIQNFPKWKRKLSKLQEFVLNNHQWERIFKQYEVILNRMVQ